MTAIKRKPVKITANRDERILAIKWNNGKECVYSFSLLRFACPCAECRGGHENMGSTPDPEVFKMPDELSPRTSVKKIEPVGTYGITILWEDGHHFGIYNWEYLYALCRDDIEKL